jgi:hypothetical protein
LNEKALQEILGLLSSARRRLQPFGGGDVAAGATVASSLIAIAQKAISAHQAVTGQPIDPSLLKPFVPLS